MICEGGGASRDYEKLSDCRFSYLRLLFKRHKTTSGVIHVLLRHIRARSNLFLTKKPN